jgi:VanZ family protein
MVSSEESDTASRADSAMTYKWRWLVVACVATLGVLLVSLVPQEVAAEMQSGLGDKIPHALVYGVLTWCWLKVFDCGRGRSIRFMLCVVLVPIAIGTVVEFTQPLVGRCCDLLDWFANVAGVGVACVFWMILPGRKRRKVGVQC